MNKSIKFEVAIKSRIKRAGKKYGIDFESDKK